MRHDPKRAYTFARGPSEQLWTDPSGIDLQASISGNERNHVFLSRSDASYSDVSLVAGVDDPGDGRVMAILDYDRDGWLDLAIANANAPRFQIFRNQAGANPLKPTQASGMIALRFVGGNQDAVASNEWSARDGYGVRVEVMVNGHRLVREHRAGEGFAGQNSATLLVGTGTAEVVEELVVRFPSGRIAQTTDIAVGSLISVFERPEDSPTRVPIVVEPYGSQADGAGVAAMATLPTSPTMRGALKDVVLALGVEPVPRLRMFTTMATWCPACRGELPQIDRLRQSFSQAELGLYGVPVDPRDDKTKLASYVARHRPAYRLLDGLEGQRIAEVKALALAAFPRDVLPTTIVTDHKGVVLSTVAGTPMISDIRRLLDDFTIAGDRR